MRRAAIKDLVKRLPKSDCSLFTIALLYSSSIYALIEESLIYLGEITSTENDGGKCTVNLIGDEHSYRLLNHYDYCNLVLVVKSKDTHMLEASIKIESFEPLSTDRWTLGLILTKLSQTVKV